MHNAGWHTSVSRPHSYSDASTATAGGVQPPNTPSPTSQSHHPAPIPPTITLSMESTSREDFTILAKEGKGKRINYVSSVLYFCFASEVYYVINMHFTTSVSIIPNITALIQLSHCSSVVSQVGQVLRGLQTEREKLRQALESESNLLASHNTTAIIAALRNSLNQVGILQI